MIVIALTLPLRRRVKAICVVPLVGESIRSRLLNASVRSLPDSSHMAGDQCLGEPVRYQIF